MSEKTSEPNTGIPDLLILERDDFDALYGGVAGICRDPMDRPDQVWTHCRADSNGKEWLIAGWFNGVTNGRVLRHVHSHNPYEDTDRRRLWVRLEKPHG